MHPIEVQKAEEQRTSLYLVQMLQCTVLISTPYGYSTVYVALSIWRARSCSWTLI